MAYASDQRSRAFAVVIVTLVALLAGIVVASSIATGASRSRIEELAGVPVELAPEDSGGAAGGATGRLTLDDGGVAVLQGFPVGSTRTTDGDTCVEWDGSSVYSGRATWRQMKGQMMLVDTPDGVVVIGPYLPPNSDAVWYRFGVPLCDGDPLWYRPSAG
ncbi:hypothetical protein CQ047_08915 [Microbacterium sp. MYb72]|uniref:hypothetical protein n=1 Tax=Microbacterium sp. MYb72 TaxID=1848693 RepID=UPI000CFCDD3D|nr:hypothetical protein [Microbacterium sp. MYb72]PRB10052.1 hypothetical protein CQ047_08915 [Microbacterium sp. MYb72]